MWWRFWWVFHERMMAVRILGRGLFSRRAYSQVVAAAEPNSSHFQACLQASLLHTQACLRRMKGPHYCQDNYTDMSCRSQYHSGRLHSAGDVRSTGGGEDAEIVTPRLLAMLEEVCAGNRTSLAEAITLGKGHTHHTNHAPSAEI